MRSKIILLFLMMSNVALFATHQRAGEISYRHINGLTYEFTIVDYVYTPSPADRPSLEIFWGDGTSTEVPRASKTNMPNDISRCVYIVNHTFPATGSYSVTLEDPNRNAGIVNIPNSVNVPFFLETVIIINPFLGFNNSVQLLNPPIDNGCVGVPYYHNPGAYDVDGDSISYALVPCKGYDGEEIPGYTYPQASHSITIDPVTGDLVWDSPQMQGEYNIAIIIREWRNGILIGSMIRDMQITIIACNNRPPDIQTIHDTCVVAGTTLAFDVTATDPNSSQVTLTATGGPFQLAESPATFNQPATGPPPVTSLFQWNTVCGHVRRLNYQVTFKAMDNGPQVNLVKIKTLRITVIAPKPENLTAAAVGNTVHISWDPSICDNIKGYKIYKRLSSYDFIPGYCETGLPAYTGYQLIGTTAEGNSVTSFIDNGSVMPLYHGNEYCYRIVAYFADNAESIVSDEVCIHLRNDVPRLINVDVEETDPGAGVILLKWLQPTEFDNSQFPGPYEYEIHRANSTAPGNFSHIGTTYSITDTSFTDTNLNTEELTYYYKIVFLQNDGTTSDIIGTSDNASSVFLNIEPSDRSLILSWKETVPWQNQEYTIYRYTNSSGTYDSLNVTGEQSYIDRNLQNKTEYCYYIRSKGGYFTSSDTVYPLYNRSQKKCAIPIDLIPPEIPVVEITTDCKDVFFTWHFSTDTSYLDVYKYYIYYKPEYIAPFTPIDSFENTGQSSYTLEGLEYITGCFAMAAVDAHNNLSELSNMTCFDVADCTPYRLPNVFTPNGDGSNDLFVPFPYDNVKSIDITIYNRWGRAVFKTTDPDINWDGKDMHTGQESSNGVYYYVCDVHLYSLSGIITTTLHGSVTLMR